MATGDITQIDSFEFDTTSAFDNSTVKISDTHFAVAYTDSAFDGYIKIFSVDSGGDTITLVSTFEYDTVVGYHASLVLIDSTHLAVAYTSSGEDGWIKTISIDGSYNMATVASLEHETSDTAHNSLVLIDSTHLGLACAVSISGSIRIKTFSFDGSYENITELDELTVGANAESQMSLVTIDSTHLALAYSSTNCFVETFSLNGSYVITSVDSYQHSASSAGQSSLALIDSTHFGLTFVDSGNAPTIKTFSINGSYAWTQIDSHTLSGDGGKQNNSLVVDGSILINASAGTNNDGFIDTFEINDSFIITELDALEHDTSNGLDNSLILLKSGIVALGYTGNGSDGFTKTFNVESATPASTGNSAFLMFV